MTELDVLRQVFDAVSEPADGTVLVARVRLVEEIDRRAAVAAPWRQPRWLRLTAAVAVVIAAALAGVVTLVGPRDDTLTGPGIAAAAARVLVPPPGVILHSVVRSSTEPKNWNGWHPTTTERWISTGTPGVVHERSDWSEWETGPCGSIRYDPRLNLLSVDGSIYPDYVRQFADPATEYLRAFRGGHVSYRGKTTFRGTPAYTLVISHPSYPLVVTYTVRRDNYYPLRTVRRHRRYADVFTYADFEQLPRNAETEALLHVGPRPNAFLLGRGGYHRAPSRCEGFRSYEHLTGKEKMP